MENRIVLNRLPDGYSEVKLYDLSGKGFRFFTGPFSFLVSLILAGVILGIKIGFDFTNFSFAWKWTYLFHIFTVIALVLLYTVIHEVTHGIVYKLLTKRKMKFGFKGSFAYCGVPGVYIGKRIALISSLTPFILYTVFFLLLLFLLPINVFWFVLLIVFMDHIGGCFADVYLSIRMMGQDDSLLVQDNGDEQHFYVLS